MMKKITVITGSLVAGGACTAAMLYALSAFTSVLIANGTAVVHKMMLLPVVNVSFDPGMLRFL